MNIDNKNFKLEEQYLNDQLAEIRDLRAKFIVDFPPSQLESLSFQEIINFLDINEEKLSRTSSTTSSSASKTVFEIKLKSASAISTSFRSRKVLIATLAIN